MLTTPATTMINQYGSQTDDVFLPETSNQSPSDGFVGLPPPPPPPPPAPPIFNTNLINTCKIFLPHQDVNLIVNRANITEIQARPISSTFTSNDNIWTRCVLPNLCIKQTVFDQHFGQSKSYPTGRTRRASASISSLGGGGNDDGSLSLVLLDVTSKMLYDVPMRHLLQSVKKDYDDDASIDHVIRAIDQAHMKSEWLDAVIALNKQFDKRPEDKARVLAHQGSTHDLVLIEQFFVKLVRVPAYEFKLIYLKFREEAPAQLERMNKHTHDLLQSIQTILTNDQLPGILHLLCLLYNSITDKTIPGLHFDSILSVLSTRTLKQTTTIAHLLCHLLEEEYPNLLNIFANQILLKLKDLSLIKYLPIYVDIRSLHARYKQLKTFEEEESIDLPEHMKTTLNDLQILFTNLFEQENQIKQGEKDLSNYFCVYDLSLETCLSTLGQFIDKLRFAHMQNLEQHRRNQFSNKQRTIQTPTRSLRNSHDPYCSNTNIFRDHLNVPLTPSTSRQRYKINRISRDRYTSSRDILYDEQQEQTTQKSLPYSIPRKREHSPIAKNILTKRPFNILGTCSINKQLDNEQQNIKMDCSINESAIVPTSICVNQPSSPLVRNLLDCSNDQSIPITIIHENQLVEYSDHSAEGSLIPKIIAENDEVSPTILTSDSENLNESSSSNQSISPDNEQKTHTIPKRASSVDNLRSISTGYSLHRNVQRCGVSRRIFSERDMEENATTSVKQSRRITSTKSKNTIQNIQSITHTSSVIRPLRACHTFTTINRESPRKSSSVPRSPHHQLTIQKSFAGRTIITNVLPSSIQLKTPKNN